MTKKSKTILFVIVIIFLSYFILIRGEEDSWICADGGWVKHGVPSAPMPEGGCGWSDNLNPLK